MEETNENKGWREKEKELKQEQYKKKEAKLIAEEVEIEEEEMEESLYDDLLIYIGVGFFLLGFILLLADNFRWTIEVKSMFIIGGILLLFGILWRFVFKHQLKKKQEEIEKLEEEMQKL